MSLSEEQIQAIKVVQSWVKDPVKFVRDCFGAEPDAWQREILKEFGGPQQRLAMKAAKGCGKSTILAWCAWWFLTCRTFPKVVATSISGDNLSDGLWTEMAKWQGKSEFHKRKFTWTKTRIFANDHEQTWWMSARTWPKGSDKSQQANTLAGLHADNLLFILDEVGGIPDAVMAAAEAGLSTGPHCKIIMAGNPTHLEGPLYRACTSERNIWYVAQITGDPDDPNRAPRISADWARTQIDKYGRDNPWVLINVFGEFPPSSLNTLLGPDDVAKAMRRNPRFEDYEFSQKRLGVDVARFGDDSTILFPRQGLMSYRPVEMRNARTGEIAARVLVAKDKWGSEVEFIDDTGGFGAGVIDSLIQAGHGPVPINFSSRPNNSRFQNKRAEIWFEMADWVKRGGALPNDPELTQELTLPTYFVNRQGKIQIEEKDQIKERIGRSPDKADALALTFSHPEMPGSAGTTHNAKMKSEWDPFQDRSA